jgi:hypothetical protein
LICHSITWCGLPASCSAFSSCRGCSGWFVILLPVSESSQAHACLHLPGDPGPCRNSIGAMSDQSCKRLVLVGKVC